MSLEALNQAEKKAVGVKQAEKSVVRNNAAQVYIANDADERVTEKLLELCRERNVEVISVESMNELGKACGIHVKAAAAAILKS